MNLKAFKILGFIFGIGVLILIIFRWLGFDGLYGQDAYEYIRQAKEIKSSLLNGSKPNDFYWAPAYPFLLALLDFLFNDLAITAQILSVITWSLTLYTLWKTYLLFVQKIDLRFLLLILGIVGFAPYFFRISFISMSDGLTTLMITLAVYFFEKYRLTGISKPIVWGVFFACMSVLTRYAAFPFAVVIILWGITQLIQHKKWTSLFAAVGSIIVSSLIFLNFKEDSPQEILNQSIVLDWNIKNFWSASIQNNQGSVNYPFPNIIYVLYSITHLGFIWLFIPVLIYGTIKRDKLQSKAISLALIIYLLFLAGIPFQNKRFLVITVPVIMIIMIPYLKRIMEELGKKWTYIVGILLLIFNIALTIYSFKTIYERNKEEVSIYQKIKEMDIKKIYTFDIDQAFSYRGFGGELVNLWLLEDFEPKKGDYYLLNVSKWSEQWRHHKLMNNVSSILENDYIILIDSLENGWELWKYE